MCMGCTSENPQVVEEKQAELAAQDGAKLSSAPEASLTIRFSFNIFC